MARSIIDGVNQILGRFFGIAAAGNLYVNGKAITSPCVDAVITVDPTATSPRAITVQLLDAEGRNLDYAENVEFIVYSSTAMTAFTTTGGSTGLAASVGAVLATVAKKVFRGISSATGAFTLSHTDTGTDACYLGVRLPNGRVIGADRVHTIGT